MGWWEAMFAITRRAMRVPIEIEVGTSKRKRRLFLDGVVQPPPYRRAFSFSKTCSSLESSEVTGPYSAFFHAGGFMGIIGDAIAGSEVVSQGQLGRQVVRPERRDGGR